MPDNQRDLKIKITTTADVSGAKETGSELNNLSDKTKDYIKKLEDQDEHEKKGIASKGEVRRGLREIGRELPLLGEAGRLVMEPLIGAFVLLTAVVAKAFEGIKELTNRSTPEFATLTDAVNKQKEAIEAVELAANAYDRALARIATTSQTVQDKYKEFQSALAARHGADDSILGKTHERDIAAIEAAEKMSLITHKEFLLRKLALDDAYFKKRMELENQYQFDRMKGKSQERFATDMEARALTKKVGQDRAAAKSADTASDFASDKVDQDKENLKRTKDKIAELQLEHNELMSQTTGMGRFTTMKPQILLEQQKKQNEIEQVSQMNIADGLRKALAREREQSADAKDHANEAKENLDDDNSRLRKDKERIHELDRELPENMRQYQFDKNLRRQEFNIDYDTRGINAGQFNRPPPPPSPVDVAPIAANIQNGAQKVTAAFQSLGKVILDGHIDFAAQILEMQRQIKILNSRVNHGALNHGMG